MVYALVEEARMATQPAPHRFTVDEYHRMAETGILGADDHVELIDGEIVEMSPIGWPHMQCVNLLAENLFRHLGGAAVVSVQNPVQTAEDQEPQPDIAVLKRNFGKRVPRPEDVLLVIEVADATLAYDRGRKLPLYARAGIAEAWIVDLQGEALERHTEPAGGAYRVATRVGRGKELESVALPGLVLRIDNLVG